QARVALFGVGERLHPRCRIAAGLVPPPGCDEAVPGALDELEQVGPTSQAAVVAKRSADADALAAEGLADQLRRELQLLAERDVRRLGDDGLRLGALRLIPHVTEDDLAVT